MCVSHYISEEIISNLDSIWEMMATVHPWWYKQPQDTSRYDVLFYWFFYDNLSLHRN